MFIAYNLDDYILWIIDEYSIEEFENCINNFDDFFCAKKYIV